MSIGEVLPIVQDDRVPGPQTALGSTGRLLLSASFSCAPATSAAPPWPEALLRQRLADLGADARVRSAGLLRAGLSASEHVREAVVSAPEA